MRGRKGELVRLIDADAWEAFFYEHMDDKHMAAAKNALDEMPTIDTVPVVRCKDCRWGREICGVIECFVDSNIPPEYHGYEWFCPNGERRDDETD